MEMRAELEAEVRVILDCFSGADGGAAFVALRRMLETLDKRAESGDVDAQRVLVVVRQFSKLVTLSVASFT